MTNTQENTEIKFGWDTCDVATSDAEYRMEEDGIDPKTCERAVSDAYFHDSCSDSFLYESAWEDLTETLSELLNEARKALDKANIEYGQLMATVEGAGWRRLDGYKDGIDYDANGQDLLSAILPDTQNTFTIHATGWTFEFTDADIERVTDDYVGVKILTVSNRHHDCPVNPELYTIYAVRECEKNPGRIFIDYGVTLVCDTEGAYVEIKHEDECGETLVNVAYMELVDGDGVYTVDGDAFKIDRIALTILYNQQDNVIRWMEDNE